MSDEHRHVAGHLPVRLPEVLLRHAVPSTRTLEAEQSSAQLVFIGAVLLKTDLGDPAVAGDEGRDSLMQERG